MTYFEQKLLDELKRLNLNAKRTANALEKLVVMLKKEDDSDDKESDA